MTAVAGRLVAYILGALLLIGLGAAGGVWLAVGHFRPLLDTTNGNLGKCQTARDNLETLTAEQGLKLGELALAGNERQSKAEQAVRKASLQVQADFAAANRLQQERTGGEQCAAATAIIDQELGL